MRAMAIFQLGEDEALYMLGPGELIGRSDMAGLCVDDPRISEAHAMVSLRGQGLELLALRGRLRVAGKRVADVEIEPGLRIEIAPKLFIECVEVRLPEHVLALDLEGLPRVMPTSTTTVFVHPKPEFKQGYDPRGHAIFWPIGQSWRVRLVDRDEIFTLDEDRHVELLGVQLSMTHVPLTEVGYAATQSTSAIDARFESAGDRVKVWRALEERPVQITGIPGKICAVLIEHKKPVPWRTIIEQVWPDDASLESALRKRFDMGLLRLRGRFKQLGLDPELLVLDGSGMLSIELPAASASDLEPLTSQVGSTDGCI